MANWLHSRTVPGYCDIITSMATTNSNRRKSNKTAKTGRTTKTTTKKTTSRAAASNAKVTSTKPKKTSAKAAVQSNVKRQLTPFERLRSMLLSMSIVYVIFAGLVLGYVNSVAEEVTAGIQGRDSFASDANVVLGPASEVLYNIEPKYILATSLLVGALLSLLLLTKLRNRYEATVASRVSGFRWLKLGIGAALTITYINLLTGVHDLSALKLSGAMIFLTALFSWMADRDNNGAAQPKWLAYILALLTGVLAWLPALVSLIGTTLYNQERFGWHVYALALTALVGFTLFALTQFRQLKAGAVLRDPADVEMTYLRIDLFTKFALVLITLLALK